MTARLSSNTAFRAVPGLPLVLLGALILPGCGSDSYPDDLNYTPRSDPIVVNPPAGNPTRLDGPGQLEQWIDSLPGLGGNLIDPTATLEKRQLAKVNEYLGKSHFDLTDEEAHAVGLTSRPEKDAAQQTLTGRQKTLTERIQATTETMKTAGPILEKTLKELFGTPAQPKVALEEPADDLDPTTLAEGSRLYRRHCLHCHGLTGDGRGPTAPWVNPHPRDYRQGEFKFTSSSIKTGLRRARREDLVRTLKAGIEGTSMPSFALLDEQKEIKPLVSYVIHLSLRGQVEFVMLSGLLAKEPSLSPEEVPDKAKDRLQKLWDNAWQGTEKSRIPVAPAPAYATKPLDQLTDADAVN